MQILYFALKNRSASLTDGNCITGLFKYKTQSLPPTRRWRLPLTFKYIWWVCVWQSEETKWPEYLSALAVFILFQLTEDQGFCCVASISFLNTVSSLLHWSKDIIVVDVVAHVHCHLGIYKSAVTWHQAVRNLILFVWSIVRRYSLQRAFYRKEF